MLHWVQNRCRSPRNNCSHLHRKLTFVPEKREQTVAIGSRENWVSWEADRDFCILLESVQWYILQSRFSSECWKYWIEYFRFLYPLIFLLSSMICPWLLCSTELHFENSFKTVPSSAVAVKQNFWVVSRDFLKLFEQFDKSVFNIQEQNSVQRKLVVTDESCFRFLPIPFYGSNRLGIVQKFWPSFFSSLIIQSWQVIAYKTKIRFVFKPSRRSKASWKFRDENGHFDCWM